MTPQVGIALYPEPRFVERAAAALALADYVELAPETYWDAGRAAGARHAATLDFVRRSGRGAVGHGVALSLGGTGDDERFERHLDAIRRDHAAFGFAWYSDHLGFVGHGGRLAPLPLPLPPTDEAVAHVAARLRRLAEIVPDVAFENTAQTFLLGAPRDEVRFVNRILAAADCGLVLDVHNVAVTCANLGASPEDYVDALDLARVVELHVSGGSASEPAWTPSGRSVRLDSHDGPVPDEVWRLLERALPRCRNVRGITVEWVADGLGPDDGPRLAADVARVRSLAC